jgi:hypothetical protein
VQQGGCVNTQLTQSTVELLTNGGFELGPTNTWQELSDASQEQIVSSAVAGVTAQGGATLARLGHMDNEVGHVYQLVTIPVGTVSLTVDGFIQVRTNDTVSGSDEAWVDLYDDPATGAFDDVFPEVWFNEDAGTTWMPIHEVGDATAYTPGSSYYFTLYGDNDVSDTTDFFFDSLSLKATVCQ